MNFKETVKKHKRAFITIGFGSVVAGSAVYLLSKKLKSNLDIPTADSELTNDTPGYTTVDSLVSAPDGTYYEILDSVGPKDEMTHYIMEKVEKVTVDSLPEPIVDPDGQSHIDVSGRQCDYNVNLPSFANNVDGKLSLIIDGANTIHAAFGTPTETGE